jgi:predicted hotdog family 3-hydroxylacyl-ACP dehydratase
MNNKLIELEEIKTIIPHRGKMLLLSRIIDYNTNGNLKAEYDITEDCLFYDPTLNGIPAFVGLELIAQSVSALSGIRDRELGKKPSIGFILSIPLMQIQIPVLKTGSIAEIFVKQCDLTEMIYTFDGEVYIEGEKALTGKLMVMEIDENDERFKDFISNFKGNN